MMKPIKIYDLDQRLYNGFYEEKHGDNIFETKVKDGFYHGAYKIIDDFGNVIEEGKYKNGIKK